MRSLVFALFLLPCTAFGQGFHLFLEGGAVSSTAATATREANDAALTAAGFTVISSREDGNGSSLSIGFGYGLTRHFALQAAYVDLGQIHYYSGTFVQGANSGNQVKEWEASGVELAGRGTLPLTAGFSLEGKLGFVALKGKFRTATGVSGSSSSRSSTGGSGTVVTIGAGLSYALTEHLTVRGMYERYSDEAGLFGEGNDLEKIQLFSIGVAYRFF